MGGTCCKATFNPNKVHVKKINEIFINYLKNQGIDTSQKTHSKGSEVITQKILESVQRHAKNSCKDLVSLMQINSKFITRICLVVAKRITEPTYTAELRLLGLSLLKELVHMPLVKRASRFSRYTNLKNLKQLTNTIRNSSPSSVSSGNVSQAPSSNPQQAQPQVTGSANENIFCIMNEKVIFKTLQEVTSFSGNESNQSNRVYFISESLDIFNFLLTTMQKLQLFESENEYLAFIEPFIDQQSYFTLKLQTLASSALPHHSIKGISQVVEEGKDHESILLQNILFESYKSYFKIVQQMKDSSFRVRFASIFRITWLLAMSAQNAVQGFQINNQDYQNSLLNDSSEVELEDIILKKDDQSAPILNLKAASESLIITSNQCQLYLLGFEILRHLSSRISVDGDQDEYFNIFLQPIFEHFETLPSGGWSCVLFAKLIFFIIINNDLKTDISFENAENQDWHNIFKSLVLSADLYQQNQGGGGSSHRNSLIFLRHSSSSQTGNKADVNGSPQNVTDHTMLDFVLDFFIKYLMKGLLPATEKPGINSSPSDGATTTPQCDENEVNAIIRKKKDMIEIMSDLIQLLSLENNIRQFNDLRFIEAVFQILSFTSQTGFLDHILETELQKQLRICIEIYLQKIKSLEQLLLILDSLMSTIQEELLGQNDFSQHLNHAKVKGLVEILINPILFFIKRLLDEEEQNGVFGFSGGVHSSNKQQDAPQKMNGYKLRKIKENHIVLMIQASKRCLEDSHVQLADILLNTAISMSLISEELMQINQHKIKGFSKDFITRYLGSLSDFIKADLISTRFKNQTLMQQLQGDDFTSQLFFVWKFFLSNLDRKSQDAVSVTYAFILHLTHIISQNTQSHADSQVPVARAKLLLHFFLCSFATQLSIQPLINHLCSLKASLSLSDAFWFMLPLPSSKESLPIYVTKLENLLQDLASHQQQLPPESLISQALKLQYFESMSTQSPIASGVSQMFAQMLEESLEGMNMQPQVLRQRLETFKMMEQQRSNVGTVNQLMESNKKTPLLYDFNQKFMIESFGGSMLDEDDAQSINREEPPSLPMQQQSQVKTRLVDSGTVQLRIQRSAQEDVKIRQMHQMIIDKLNMSLTSEIASSDNNNIPPVYNQEEDYNYRAQNHEQAIMSQPAGDASNNSPMSELVFKHQPSNMIAKFRVQDYGIDQHLLN